MRKRQWPFPAQALLLALVLAWSELRNSQPFELLPGSRYNLSSGISISVALNDTAASISTSTGLQLAGTVSGTSQLLLSASTPGACSTSLLALTKLLCSAQAEFTGVKLTSTLLNIKQWTYQSLSLNNFSIACPGVQSATPAIVTCAGTTVSRNETLFAAVTSLQAQHDNVTIYLIPGRFYHIVPAFGWGTPQNATQLYRNVSLIGSDVHELAWIDFRAEPTTLNISQTAVLYLCGLLHLSNAHRRVGITNMIFGPDNAFPSSSFIGNLWNIQRPATTSTRIVIRDNIMVYPADVQTYLSYWYARYLSPIASISSTAQWVANNNGLFTLDDFQLALSNNPASNDIINVVKKYSNIMVYNMTQVSASEQYPLLPPIQQTGILQWGLDPYAAVPSAMSSCNPSQLAGGLSFTTAQPYVIQVCNVRMVNSSANGSSLPPSPVSSPPSPPPQRQGPGTFPFSVSIPARVSMYWQGHPLRSLAVDMVGQAESVVLGLGSQLTIRNLTLLNTATQPASARSASPDPLQDFSTALWALGNISSDSSVTLDLVTLFIPQQELALLHLFASGASTCGCSLSSNTQATLSRIFDASLVSSQTNTSLVFARIRFLRWSGTRVTLTSDASSTPFALLPGTPLAAVTFYPASSGRSKPDLRWVVPVSVLGGLLGLAGLLGAVWLWRRSATRRMHMQAQLDLAQETGLQPLHPKPGFRHNSQGSSWVPGSDGVTGSQAGVDKVAFQASSDLLGFLWESADAHKEGNGSQTWMDLLPDDPDSQLAEQAQQLVTGYTHGNDPFGRQGADPDIQVPTSNGGELAAEAALSLPAVEGAGPLVPPAPLDLLFVGRISHHEADKGVPIAGANTLGALPGNCLPPATVSEKSAVRLSSFGTSSIGSGASRMEESSMAMMSDSFDRPGSEYGDWRNLGAESDKLLMQAKCDVGQGGRLTISDVLGAGAHGVVYRGEWRGRPVAVKCLLFQEHRIHTKRQALQEAAINTKLAHPNIVNTYTFDLRAVGTNNDMLVAKSALEKKDGHMSIAEDQAVAGDWKMYIVQEYCDGGHLKRAVDSAALTEDGSTPNLLAVVNMALDIACGVQHIHSKNIIHGDLSPANILLKLDDSRPGCLKAVAKVGDFGLSHMSKDGQSHVSNVRQGTPFYTAPEVLMEGRLTKAADVYSFGVILHELYCGQPAWRRRHRSNQPASQRVAGSSGQQGDSYNRQDTQPTTPTELSGSDTAPPGQTNCSSHTSSSAATAKLPSATHRTVDMDSAGNSSKAPASAGCEPATSSAPPEGPQVAPTTTTTPAAVAPSPPAAVLHHPTTTQATLRALQRYAMAPDQFRSCPLRFPDSCPQWYARLAAACMSSQLEMRPKLFDVVKLLLVQQQELVKALAANK
ncbi:hypothetical protein QJQ45_024241, partial [Haematococcus lacustris]